jgi:mannosylglycerate hydrolase
MEQGYEMHVICNTHWDREWLYNFQDTRMFLVDFMDKLIEIFDEEPGYAHYLMDSQVIPIEDYLEVRPEMTEKVKKYVSEGRLNIGPWYTLPEEFNVSGESIVRNLLLGHKMSEEYGGVTKTGYSPFSYGQNSQMAQIYRGFDIDTILFYHGIHKDETKSEFILEAPDGSWVYGSRMGSFARYNFYFSVWRPAVYGKKINERGYTKDMGGLPFHLAGPNRYMGHHFLLDPKKELNDDNLREALAQMKTDELEHARTRYLALMQGMDSTQPDLLEVEIVRRSEKLLEDGDNMVFSSMPAYLEKVKEAVKDMDLTRLKGERRTPRPIGHLVHLYGDVTSGRSRMKQANTKTEYALQRLGEPFAVIANALGTEYPKTIVDMSYKYLLKCHPHDSIAGSGIDQIEKDVLNRLDQSKNIAEGVMRRALGNIQVRVDNSDIREDELVLTVFNPSPVLRSEVVTAFVDFPDEMEMEYFTMREAASGKEVPYQEVSRCQNMAVVRHLADATLEMPSDQLKIHFEAVDLPALGYRTYIIRKDEARHFTLGDIFVGGRTLENEFLRVKVASDGTLTVNDKMNDRVYSGLNEFEDDGEAGHPWRHVHPAFDEAISSVGQPFSVSLIERGPLSAALKIEHRMLIPVKLEENDSDRVRRIDYDGDAASRSKEKREMIITSVVRLTKDAKGLQITTSFDNSCTDHRLRVSFPTGLSKSVNSCAHTPFDVVERSIDRPEGSDWAGSPNPTHPMGRFVDVSDGANGMALVNDGLREYEVTDNAERRIYLTLMRAYQIELATVAWRWEKHPEMGLSQCPGGHEFTYMIYPHAGDWADGKVFTQVEKLNVPLEVAQVGPHDGELPKELSFLGMGPEDLVLTGMKVAEDGEGIVIRALNPTDREVTGSITSWKPIVKAQMLQLSEKVTSDLTPSGSEVTFTAAPKKIVTVRIVLG